jgi:hypothetical protein
MLAEVASMFLKYGYGSVVRKFNDYEALGGEDFAHHKTSVVELCT